MRLSIYNTRVGNQLVFFYSLVIYLSIILTLSIVIITNTPLRTQIPLVGPGKLMPRDH